MRGCAHFGGDRNGISMGRGRWYPIELHRLGMQSSLLNLAACQISERRTSFDFSRLWSHEAWGHMKIRQAAALHKAREENILAQSREVEVKLLLGWQTNYSACADASVPQSVQLTRFISVWTKHESFPRHTIAAFLHKNERIHDGLATIVGVRRHMLATMSHESLHDLLFCSHLPATQKRRRRASRPRPATGYCGPRT